MPTYTVWTGEPKLLARPDWDSFPASVSPDTLTKTVVQLTGSRKIVDREWVYRLLDTLGLDPDDVILVTGDAPGFDTLGKHWGAERKVHRIVKFPAPWQEMPGVAGFRRNEAMARFSAHMKSLGLKVIVIAATYQGTGGTAHMVKASRKAGLRVLTVPYGAEAA